MAPRVTLTPEELAAINVLLDQKKFEQAAALGDALRAGATLPPDAARRLAAVPAQTRQPQQEGRTAEQIMAENERKAGERALQSGKAVRGARDAEAERIVQSEGVSFEEARKRAEGIVSDVISRVDPPDLGIRTGRVTEAGNSPKAILEALRPQAVARGPEYEAPTSLAGKTLDWALTSTNEATGEVRESLPLAALRGIGSLWQFVDVPVMQALTYEVDEAGKPVDPEDKAYRISRTLQGAESQIRQDRTSTTSIIPRPFQASERSRDGMGGQETGEYWQDVAQAIARGRMLGDDLQALPEYREALGGGRAPWWIGLGAELLRPVAPLPVSAALKGGAAAARAARVSKALPGVVAVADIPRIATGALDSHTIAAKAADLAAPRMAALVTSTNPSDVQRVAAVLAATQDSSPLRRAVLEAQQATKGPDGTLVARPREAAEKAARQSLLESGAEIGYNDYLLLTDTLAVSKKAWERGGAEVLGQTRSALAAAAKGDEAPLLKVLENKALPARSQQRLRRALSTYDPAAPKVSNTLADAALEAFATTGRLGVGLRRTGQLATKAAVPDTLRWQAARDVEDIAQAVVPRAVLDAAKSFTSRWRPKLSTAAPIEVDAAAKRVRAQGATISKLLTSELQAQRAAGVKPSTALNEALAKEGVTLQDVLQVMLGPGAKDAAEMLDVRHGISAAAPATIATVTRARDLIAQDLPGVLVETMDRTGKNIVSPMAGAWMQRRMTKILADEMVAVLDEPYSVGIPFPAGVPPATVQSSIRLLTEGKLIQGDPLTSVAADVAEDLAARGLLPSTVPPAWLRDLDEAVTQRLFDLGLYSADDMAQLVPRLAIDLARPTQASTVAALVGEDLARELQNLARQVSASSVRRSLSETLESNATTGDRIGVTVFAFLSAFRRLLVQGALGGLLTPNLRYLGVNLMTAPLIAATTLSVPDALYSTGITRLLSGELLTGKAADAVVFTTPAGVQWTREAVEQAMARNTLGTSRQAAEFAEAATDEFLRAVRLTEKGADASAIRQVARWANPFAKNLWSELADKSDRFFRENVFLTALSQGIPESQAAKMAAESMLDYSAIGRKERELVGQFIMFWSFQRQMGLATLKALVNRPSLLARLSRLQQASMREWTDGNGDPAIPEWYASRPVIPGSRRELLSKGQGQRIAVNVGPSIPPLEPGAELLLPALLALVGTDEQRLKALEELVYTPELQYLLNVQKGPEAGWYGRFPVQYLEALDTLPAAQRESLMQYFELSPMPASRVREGMASERVETGARGQSVQYGFRSKEGKNRFLLAVYGLQRAGLDRTLGDLGKGKAIAREMGPAAAAAYAAGAMTPVSASTTDIDLTWKNKSMLRELQSLDSSAEKE